MNVHDPAQTRFPRRPGRGAVGSHVLRLLPAAAFWLALCPSLAAEDLQVNTYTTGDQLMSAVASSSAGDFVVVWGSYGSGGTDTGSYSVQRRRYAPTGIPIGGQSQVNTYTTNHQLVPVVAMDSDGDFVIVWQSYGSGGSDTSGPSIQGRRYAASGTPIGGQFQVNSYTTSYQTLAAVAMSTSGDFVVVWQSDGSYGTDTSEYSIQGQLYAASGEPIGGQFQVNSYTTASQSSPAVAMSGDGDFLVVWAGYGSLGTDISHLSVQGQLYAASGMPLGSQFQVNTYTTSHQSRPAVAMRGEGDFVVVWESDGSFGTDTSYFSIQGRLYASSGLSIGGQFQINTYTAGNQRVPKIAMRSEGDFVVVWGSYGSDGSDTSGSSIQARRYAANGTPGGAQFQVNSYTTSYQGNPAVTISSAGDFVVVWNSLGSAGTDTSGSSVQAFFSAIFTDGFESGDIGAWSSVVP